MKLLKRNTTEFTYSAYEGKTEILNNGKHTGKFTLSYSNPVTYRGNISVPAGQVNQQWFGIDVKYTHILLMDDPEAAITESGLIQWKGKTYLIKAVRPSPNVLAIALSQTVQGDSE